LSEGVWAARGRATLVPVRRSDKQWRDAEEPTQSFLPDAADDGPRELADLRDRLARLEQQVGAQYTATAAYATLAQRGLDDARAEARADLDRVHAGLVDLLDRLRAEVLARIDAVDTSRSFAGGASADGVEARLAAMEDRIGGLMRALEASVHENVQLRQQIAELQAKVMQQDGWLVSGGGPSDLDLR
jgi:hypothetical protein